MRTRKIRNIVAVIAGIMILIHSFEVNFMDVSWKENKSSYLGIISMVFVFIAMVFPNKHDRKSRKRSTKK